MQDPVKAKIDHYQQFLQRRSQRRGGSPNLEFIKLSVKEPQYIYKHHDQAYLNLGVQDNTMNHNNHHFVSVSPSAAFENPIIARAFYILMTLIVVLIVSSVLAFTIREYFLFQKAKEDSANNSELKHENSFTSSGVYEEKKIAAAIEPDDLLSLEKVIQNNKAPAIVKDESGLTKFANDTSTAQNREWGLQQKYDLTSAAISMDIAGSERREKDHVSGFSDKSISKYAIGGSTPLGSSIKDGKIRYTMDELQNLNTFKLSSEVIRKSSSCGVQKIPISQLVKCPVNFPATRFQHSWEANKALMEISKVLNDPELKTEKLLAALKLVSLGKQREFFENPNLYLGSFTTCIEDLVHTCALFDLWSYCSATLTVLFVECLLTYCWSHARYQVQNGTKLSLVQQFTKWNGRSPTVQSQMSILHLLFNVFLGFKTASALPEDIAKENELKLGLVIRELIKKSACNDYIQILPLIARASEAASNNRTKLFFYEMTKLLVTSHRNCCINVYLKDSNFELKTLLKKGFLNTPESDPIHKRAKEILGIILECSKDAEIWQLEILNSENHIPSPSSLPLSSEYTERLFVQEGKSEY
ncbi:hypothetical protein KGF57_001015 [Candida theae]|uniref:Uncharacterized protein n=1 Tax=Candida theae TaxID=1198502 RepID=A0AAD5G074_9ASCO|nr:uncharacterized protein KGF57_001015 [Candida theae]KAI5964523.1 hypothetical protein KGF57_001015 [Candida theae]